MVNASGDWVLVLSVPHQLNGYQLPVVPNRLLVVIRCGSACVAKLFECVESVKH